MASSSKRPGKAAKKSILTPVMTLEGHKTWVFPPPDDKFKCVLCISYFPNGKEMISGSGDKTIRRWDLQEGKEIEEAREVCENRMSIVGVSRDGRWVVTAGGGPLKVCEVETGIVRTFYDGFDYIWAIDISTDSTLLAGASFDYTVQIWSLATGELVAGPFIFGDDYCGPPALRFSENSRKLAVLSNQGKCLQVWDVQTQKLDVTRGKSTPNRPGFSVPVFWTTKDKSIIVAFSFTDDYDSPTTIYEFDASTLETVGDSFEGHTKYITGLALSFDCALLVSASHDSTIKLWSFGSRQLLASFDVHNSFVLILSPDSRQLAYTTWDEPKIYICDIPLNILASVGLAEEAQPSTSKPERPCPANMLNSDATRRTVRRQPVILPVISSIPRPPRPLPTNTRFPRFLRKLLPSRTDAVRAVRADEPRNLLDSPATAPLPRLHPDPHENSRPPPAPPTTKSWWPIRTGQTSSAIVDVPLAQGKERNASADAPAKDDSEWIRDEDYVSPPPSPNPDSQQPHIAGQINTGEHGSGRLCFCL